MTRNAYVLHDHKLVIFWTQKGANTSIGSSIVRDILKIENAVIQSGNGGARGYLNRNKFRYGYPGAHKLVVNEGYKSIALLRDPYDRMRSGFLNKFVRYKNKPLLTLDSLEPFARQLYLKLPPALGRSQDAYDGLSFHEFATLICDQIGHLDENGEPTVDRHFNTQVSFKQWKKDGFQYDYVYNLEQTDAFFAKLQELTGAEVKERMANRTPMKEITDPNLVHMNCLDMADTERFGKAQFEDADLRALVEKTFECDYSYVRQTMAAQG